MRMAAKKKKNSLLIAAEQGIRRRDDARGELAAATARIQGSWLAPLSKWRELVEWAHDTLCKPVTIVMVPA